MWTPPAVRVETSTIARGLLPSYANSTLAYAIKQIRKSKVAVESFLV